MNKMENWSIACLDGHDQAALVQTGEVLPIELVETAIARIELLDPALNCISYKSFDFARKAVANMNPNLPFAGVPYLIKDSMDFPGMPLQSGSRSCKNRMGKHLYPMGQRFNEAGLIPVGKSTMPEFGLNATAETLLKGATRNPWNLDVIAGGSSSGAAVAVAAGLTPFAHASDAGGSIRLPASNCGIVGFKPSRSWNVRARAYNVVDDILCSDGLYSRSVRDTIWAAQWLRPAHIMPRPMPERRLRIAVDLYGFDGAVADPDVNVVILETAKLCETLGHKVEDRRMPIDGAALRKAFTTLWSYLGGEIVDHFGSSATMQVEQLLEPWTIGLAQKRAEITPTDLVEAFAVIERTSRALVPFYDEFDVVLSPVTRSAPLSIGAIAPTCPFDELWENLFDYINYTPLHNMTGAPSLSLPLFMNPAGLPVGSLFSANLGDDDILLTLALELESARPWANVWPPLAN